MTKMIMVIVMLGVNYIIIESEYDLCLQKPNSHIASIFIMKFIHYDKINNTYCFKFRDNYKCIFNESHIRFNYNIKINNCYVLYHNRVYNTQKLLFDIIYDINEQKLLVDENYILKYFATRR